MIKDKAKIVRIIGISLITMSSLSIALTTLAWLAKPKSSTDEHADGTIGLRGYFYSGNGTKESPYEITKPSHFYNLSRLQSLGIFTDRSNSGEQTYFRLGHLENDGGTPDDTSDDTICLFEDDGVTPIYPTVTVNNNEVANEDFYIDMSTLGTRIRPIGSEETPFTGVFEGYGVPVKHLEVEGNPEDIGVFGYVSYEGKVNGLICDDIKIYSLGYNDTPGVVELFGQNIDDIFDSQADYLCKDTSFRMYSPNEVELKSTVTTNLNESGGTILSNLNRSVDSQGVYTGAYFRPVFPDKAVHTSDPFEYSWKSSSGLLRSTTKNLVNGSEGDVETGIEKILIDLDNFPIASEAGKWFDTRLSLIASVEEGGYVYSRVIQSYSFNFELKSADVFKYTGHGGAATYNPSNWTKIEGIEEYSAEKSYNRKYNNSGNPIDIVMHEGHYYYLVSDSTTGDFDPDAWNLINQFNRETNYPDSASSTTFVYYADIDVTILCDYVREGDDHATNYHHGTNVGFLAGHVDGSFTNSYVFNGEFHLNDETTNHKIGSETDTGLIGEIGNNVANSLDPDFTLSSVGDTGVINFSKIYNGIRYDAKIGDKPAYGKTGNNYYLSIENYMKDGSLGREKGEFYDLYEKYLRYVSYNDVPGKHYISKIDATLKENHVYYADGVSLTKEHININGANSLEFSWNNVIEDEDSLGVFKIVTTNNTNTKGKTATNANWVAVSSFPTIFPANFLKGETIVRDGILYECNCDLVVVADGNLQTNHRTQLSAPSYNAANDYAIGAYVVKDNKLYRAKVAVKSGDEYVWSDRWDEISFTTYSNSAQYEKGAIVKTGNNYYQFRIAVDRSTNGFDGFNSNHWTKVEGNNYSFYTKYNKNDIVMHDGKYYICKENLASAEKWTDDSWAQITNYDSSVAYEADKHYVIHEENSTRRVYKCSADTPDPAGDWDSSKWTFVKNFVDYTSSSSYSITDTIVKNGTYYNYNYAHNDYYGSGIGSSRIINGPARDKVYFSTAEYVTQKYNNVTKTWESVNNNSISWSNTTNSIAPLRATTIPTHSDSSTFDYNFSRDYNYCFELDLSQMSFSGSKNYMWNTQSDFLKNYLSSILVSKTGDPIKPRDKQFGFMFRSDENEVLSSLSAYMKINKPGATVSYGAGKYYPSNSIVFDIENSNGANVSVVGNGGDISIYRFDPTTNNNTPQIVSTMRSRNSTYYATSGDTSDMYASEYDIHKYFSYDIKTGATSDVAIESSYNYSPSRTYSVGDVVYNSQGSLPFWYLCVVDVTEPTNVFDVESSVGDGSHWRAIPKHASSAPHEPGDYVVRNGTLLRCIKYYDGSSGKWDDKQAACYEAVETRGRDDRALYGHIFKLPKGHYVIGAENGANLYFLAVQGQKKGTILIDDTETGPERNVVEDVDFLLSSPTCFAYQNEALDRANFTFQATFNEHNYSSNFIVDVYVDGTRKYMRLRFGKSPAFVSYLYLHSRLMDASGGYHSYYINSDEPYNSSDYVYPDL